MAATVMVVDEWAPGGAASEWALEVSAERVTARDLIRERVYQEVADYNVGAAGHFRGLVQPTDAERELNGYRLRKGQRIDGEAQVEQALAAFERHRFLLLVDNCQLSHLDEEAVLRPGCQVTFLRLVPLMGG